jgi:hypothetical protein
VASVNLSHFFYREVIQEGAFIAEKNAINTPKIHQLAITSPFSLVIEGG